jgi:hypothetical protein
VLQVFAYRDSEGDLGRVAAATKRDYLIQLWPAAGPAISTMWPPENTVDDDGLAVLDDRFVNILARPS